MFNVIEKEVSELICKDPFKYCILGVHNTPDMSDVYTIFVRGDIITKDMYIKDQTEYDACRISLLYPRYVDLGYNIRMTKDELIWFNQSITNHWDLIKSYSNRINTVPDYMKLQR